MPRESFRDGWSRVILGNKTAKSLLCLPRVLVSCVIPPPETFRLWREWG